MFLPSLTLEYARKQALIEMGSGTLSTKKMMRDFQRAISSNHIDMNRKQNSRLYKEAIQSTKLNENQFLLFWTVVYVLVLPIEVLAMGDVIKFMP